MQIGSAAEASGVSAKMIRHYESIGLITSGARRTNNYRDYDRRDVHELRFIRSARDLGFSLDKVRELLALASQDQSDCASVDAIASAHLAEVERKLADLAALRRELSAVISSCKGGVIAECRILEALGPQ